MCIHARLDTRLDTRLDARLDARRDAGVISHFIEDDFQDDRSKKKRSRVFQMKNWSKKVFWILWFFLGTGLALSAPLVPSLQAPASDYDFGEIEEGRILSHDYLIKNTGPGILEIYDVRPG